LVDALLKDVGLSGGSIEGLTGALNEIVSTPENAELDLQNEASEPSAEQ
jgi:hypothetical protein